MNASEIVPIFIGVIFVFVIGSIIINAAKSIAEWTNNNAQPRQDDPARVVTKRTETTGRVSHNRRGRVWTTYFVTFELKSGHRMEFSLEGREYGLLAEGDEGVLMYQGTRYLGFQRRSQAMV
jgi:Protein of unknown function (DUF2500)